MALFFLLSYFRPIFIVLVVSAQHFYLAAYENDKNSVQIFDKLTCGLVFLSVSKFKTEKPARKL